MNVVKVWALAIAGVAISLGSQDAIAQHYPSGYGGYHIDHHDHIIQDRHGHVIGRQHHDVIHSNRGHFPPHTEHHPGHHPPRLVYPQPTYVAPAHDPHPHHPPYVGEPSPTVYRSARPINVEFGGFSHVDELASGLETLSRELLLDLHHNYSHNPGFRETYREAYRIFEVARYIHAAEHQHDRDAVASKLRGLDADLHHVQDDVRGWSRHHHRQIGQLGILTKLDRVESSLHHLMNDVGVSPSAVGNSPQTPSPSTYPDPSLISSPPPAF